MRILYLCQRIPYPPDRGDRIPVFHQVKRLCRGHEVVVASLAHGGTSGNASGLRKELGVTVLAPRHSRFRLLKEMTLAYCTRSPLTLGYFRNSRLQSAIDAELARRTYDAIIVFSSSMAPYVERVKNIPRIMNFCDVDSQKWSSMAGKSGGLKRWIYRRESRLLLQYERKIAARFDACCVVSKNEADLFRRLIPGIPVHVIENGVDVDYFSATPRCANGLKIVFTGIMDYEPNVEAVSFFVEQVWDKIRASYPDARFTIVGSRPVRKIRNYAHIPGIEVTGHVRDVRPYLSSATISIAPLAIARGVQNKILEAMAAGVPVLTTPAVAKGLPEGAEALVMTAERIPEAFASTLLNMGKNQVALLKNGRKAQEFMRRNHTWDITLEALDDLLRNVTPKSKNI